MVEFKKNVKKVLPYNREQYIEFLDDDFESPIEWYGVSFQLGNEREKNGLSEFVETYKSFFDNIVLKLDNGSFWIVNHDDKDLKWLPNQEDTLTSLRNLFKQKNVPDTFKGALIFSKDDLLKLAKDIISYPCGLFKEDALLYKNLDISHGEINFIIKITGHLTIDLLSTDKEILRKVVKENTSDKFTVKEYRGTSLGL